MKIAMMVRAYLPVPRPADMIYAPIDLAVAIAEGLAKRGHKVDLFAPLGSHLKQANVESLNLRPLATNQIEFQSVLNDSAKMSHYVPGLWDSYMVNEMFARASKGNYDLLHFHHPESALPLAQANTGVPVVYTLHDPVFPWYKELFELYQTPNQHYVSISDNQRRDAPDLPYASKVYNGIDSNLFTFSEEAEDYLLIAGRIVPEKGFKEAIQVAQQTGKRLYIAGPVYPDQQGYFDQYIKPFLHDKILYLGYLEQEQLVRYYQKAEALLMPIQWEEPFGLTMVEAMACGTPVIALHRGSVPEIVKHGETGFVVHSIADMAEAVGHIPEISRAACRKHVEENFNLEKMVDGYEATFEKVLRSRRKVLNRTFVKTQLRRGASALKAAKDKVKGPNEDGQLNLHL